MSYFRQKVNFTSGEVSHELYARMDNDRYKNGCKTVKNMTVKAQGPVTRRSGFEFIYDLSDLSIDDSVTPKFVPFTFDKEHAYMIIFFLHTGGLVRAVFGTDGAMVLDDDGSGDVYQFEFNGTMDIDEMTFAQSNDILFITQPDRMPIEFKRFGAADWTANEMSVTTPPYVLNTSEITIKPSGTTGDITLTASEDLFTDDFIDHTLTVNGGTMEITAVTSTTVASATVSTDLEDTTTTTQWSSEEWGPVNGYPEYVGFYEQRLLFASNTARPQTTWFSQSGNYYDFSVSSPIVESDAITATFDSGTQNKVQWIVPAASLLVGTLGDEWVVSGGGSPISFSTITATRNTNHGGEKLPALMIGLSIIFLERHGRTVEQIVYDYVYGTYSTSDLSVLAPHLTEKYTITAWCYQQTPSGIIWSVREDGALLGLTFKKEHNVIGWHTHDTEGEFKCCGCIPGDVEDDLWVLVKRWLPAVATEEVYADNVVFKDADGHELTEEELSALAEDEDGLTIMSDYEIVQAGLAEAWGPHYYVERKAPEFTSDDVLDSYFLDSFAVYNGDAASVISGLEHLEGLTVDVLGDGMVMSGYTVENGQITLPISVERAVVGLPYTSEVLPILPDFALSNQGTTMTSPRRTDHLQIMLYRSLGCKIGRYDSERGEIGEEEIPFRTPADEVGEAVPLFQGVKSVSLTNGSDRASDIFIRQTKPLPLTVVGIIDELQVNG